MAAKRDNCGIARVTHGNLEIWNQPPNENWMLVENHCVAAEVRIQTTTKRRRDLTGMRQYKVITEHRVWITVRVGYKQEIEIGGKDGFLFRGGEVATLKKLLRLWTDGALWGECRLAAWRLSKAAGVSETARSKADLDYNWEDEEGAQARQVVRNHLRTIKEMT